MSCYNPLTGRMKQGKPFRFKHYSSHFTFKLDLNNNWRDLDMLPCRKCIGCRLDYARE